MDASHRTSSNEMASPFNRMVCYSHETAQPTLVRGRREMMSMGSKERRRKRGQLGCDNQSNSMIDGEEKRRVMTTHVVMSVIVERLKEPLICLVGGCVVEK